MSIIVANNELTVEILKQMLVVDVFKRIHNEPYFKIMQSPKIYICPLTREPHSSDIELGIPDLQEMMLLHAMSLPIAEILDIVIDKKLGIE